MERVKNRHSTLGLATMILVLSWCSETLTASPAVLDDGLGTRTVRFPADRSMGNLRLRDWGSTDTWKILGEARGDVAVTSLEQLRLSGSKITNAALPHLKHLTSLEELGLFRTQITGAGLSQLDGLTLLRRLHLDGSQISDAGKGGTVDLGGKPLNDQAYEKHIFAPQNSGVEVLFDQTP